MRETKRAGQIIHDWNIVQKCFAVNLSGNQYQMWGLPDCFVAINRRVIWIEFKDEDEVIPLHQRKVHEKFAKQGVHVYIVRFYDKLWTIDDTYQIRFKFLADGYKLLLDTLIELDRADQKKGEAIACVPIDIAATFNSRQEQSTS